MREMELNIGERIDEGIKRAIFLAGALDESLFWGSCNLVAFDANGVRVVVAASSNAGLIYRDWCRALSGYINPEYVGPYPNKTLTTEELEKDFEIGMQQLIEYEVRYAKEKAKVDAKRKTLEKKISAIAMELVNKELWYEGKAKNIDPYGKGVYDYAESWACLMQLEIEQEGKKLEDIASETSREADIDGITGFMYGCAVGILAVVWIYGEQLRCWHNKKIQISNEGDRANEEGIVLNPALLRLELSE